MNTASKKGDEKKVRDLQRQLMNSFPALVLATDRVTKKSILKIGGHFLFILLEKDLFEPYVW